MSKLPKNSRVERDGDFWTRYDTPNTGKAVDAYYEIAKTAYQEGCMAGLHKN